MLRRDMTTERIQESMSLMRRSSSIKRSVSRHTRNLLRQYVAENRLSQPVPMRDVQSVAIEMNEDERGLYDDIRDLVRECYQGRTNVNRQALGFVMTHFRLRLGSSLYAFQRSLEDLNERAQTGHIDEIQWDDLPVGDEDNYSDLDPETVIPGPELTSKGQQMLTDMLDRCRAQASLDSKFTSLLAEIARLRSKGYGKVMVFSQFRGHPGVVARAIRERKWRFPASGTIRLRGLDISTVGPSLCPSGQRSGGSAIQGTATRNSPMYRDRRRVPELPVLLRDHQLRHTVEPDALGTADWSY